MLQITARRSRRSHSISRFHRFINSGQVFGTHRYLGAWYPSKTLSQTPPPWPVTPEKVVSAKAYTQGWTWRVAQAHPMGYSELRFGYWSDVPPPLNDIIKATS
jgi:hypothetical protein